jgi:hypothetical protein
MSKKIKTNDTDVVICTTTIEVVSINGISFEHDEELPCVSIYIVGDGDKEFYEEVESQGIVGLEDLKRFALNWYFDNVEIVREISSCIGEGRNTVDLRGALEEVRLNLMAIDMNGDPGVDSFVNDSIEIINEALKTETAQEVSVQEQSIKDIISEISILLITASSMTKALKNMVND